MTLEDPALMNHPWIYIVAPGNLRLKEAEVPIFREYCSAAARSRSTISTARSSGPTPSAK